MTASRMSRPASTARTITLCLAMGLAVAGWHGVAAQSAVEEGVEVLPVVTVTGVPVSIAYDRHGLPIAPGGWSDPELVLVTVSSNAPVRVDLAASDFTGPVTLPADIRFIRVGEGRHGLVETAASTLLPRPASEVVSWNPIYHSDGPVRGAWFLLTLRAHPPLGTPGGTYHAATELTFTAGSAIGPAAIPPTTPDAPDPSVPAPGDPEGGAAADPDPGKVRPGG